MIKDFTEIMAQRTNKELATILTTKRHEYQVNAITSAQIEFEKRQLKISDYITNEEIKESENAKEPIDKKEIKFNWLYKLITFFSLGKVAFIMNFISKYILEIPLFYIVTIVLTIILQIIIFKEFNKRGYNRLALDLKNWALNGWIFYCGLAVIIYILETFLGT